MGRDRPSVDHQTVVADRQLTPNDQVSIRDLNGNLTLILENHNGVRDLEGNLRSRKRTIPRNDDQLDRRRCLGEITHGFSDVGFSRERPTGECHQHSEQIIPRHRLICTPRIDPVDEYSSLVGEARD